MHSDSGDYTYRAPAPAYTVSAGELRQFDLRTAPDRLQAYCDALDRRIDALEAEFVTLRQRLARLEWIEAQP